MYVLFIKFENFNPKKLHQIFEDIIERCELSYNIILSCIVMCLL